MNFLFILAFILAYLIGAIPFSVLTGKLFFGIDVRKSGSGNAGATNTMRVLGKRAGFAVLVLDVAKGMFAVSLSYYLGKISMADDKFILYQLGLGMAATLGHIFPVYLWFKGGKGVATLFGVILAIFPVAAGVCTLVFFLMFFISKYVSLSSMLASIFFPLSVIFLLKDFYLPVIIFSMLIPALVIYTHRENISRLRNGTENKFSFGRKQ